MSKWYAHNKYKTIIYRACGKDVYTASDNHKMGRHFIVILNMLVKEGEMREMTDDEVTKYLLVQR